MMESALFYWFAFVSLIGAVLTVTRRSPVLGAVWLTVSLLGVAGLFLLLGAEFLFAAQIIIYIGGITLLFLFVIMLVNLEASSRVRQFRRGWPLFVAAGLGLSTELILLLKRGNIADFPPVTVAQPQNALAFSDGLLAQQFVAFELISVLLLVAIVGSVWMGQQRKRSTPEGET